MSSVPQVNHELVIKSRNLDPTCTGVCRWPSDFSFTHLSHSPAQIKSSESQEIAEGLLTLNNSSALHGVTYLQPIFGSIYVDLHAIALRQAQRAFTNCIYTSSVKEKSSLDRERTKLFNLVLYGRLSILLCTVQALEPPFDIFLLQSSN